MKPHLEFVAAEAVVRRPVVVGDTRRFYSDCVECKTDAGNLIRSYSGQEVRVVMAHSHVNDEGDTIHTFTVEAANGDAFTANEGELNGWIFDTGQWVGPRVF